MNGIELIITCENCGHVEHFETFSESECAKIFQQFSCPGQCSPRLYSYITIGEATADSILNPIEVAQVA